MTLVRESFVLPAIFLTVALLGGLRIAETVRLMGPSLMALVLAMLLLGCLVRSRALAPERLMNTGRPVLANLSGLVVLLTLFAACAQVFNLLTPETGLLFLLFSVFFCVQLLTTLAAVRDRIPLLQALAILVGAAFLIRFVALEALYAPEGGTLQRVLTVLMEGFTLGALEYQPHAPATGYVAFFTLGLFLTGLVLLPAAEEPRIDLLVPGARDAELIAEEPRPRIPGATLLVLFLGASQWACSPSSPPVTVPIDSNAAAIREQALASARVWRAPAIPVSRARLGANPPGGWHHSDEVECRFVYEPVGGMTPKFDCQLPNGEIVKVKYGRTNEELYTEVAATRLLSALGFGSDRMFVVRRVRCAGCPKLPFLALRCSERTGLRSACLAAAFALGDETAFDHVAVERRLPGRRIEAFDGQGWAWYELDAIDPARGGASRAEVDAFRLMAVILAHWDNKAGNQRLLCLPGGDRPDGSCETPLAIMHDVGGTFGPTKIDLQNWRRVPVWTDPRACIVSMKKLPFDGATFPDRQISEGGRQMLLRLLEQLSARQLEELFTASRMTAFDTFGSESRRATNWVQAFRHKVQQLREGGPCPGAPIKSPDG